jgi:polyferredoxin
MNSANDPILPLLVLALLAGVLVAFLAISTGKLVVLVATALGRLWACLYTPKPILSARAVYAPIFEP